MRRLIAIAVVAAFAAVAAPAALAATATPFGGATVSDGILTLVSNTGDTGTTNDASGASFSGTGVTTFSSITHLSTEFDVTDDDCSSGSPRFQVRVQTPSGEKNVFVYLGPTPSFTGCAKNVWTASGDLSDSSELRVDLTQVGGAFYSTWAQAVALVGSHTVTGISLVVDSGWAFADKEQTVRIRNVRINASTFYTGEVTPPKGGLNPAQACRQIRSEMGAENFRLKYGTNANGANAFGKCVSTMARMKHDAARSAAVHRIDAAAARCVKLAVAKKGKGKAKGLAKHAKLRSCLRSA